MIGLLWQMSKGHRLMPWRSPYLRWRIETYWGLHAEQIGFQQFWGFVWAHRTEMIRFLHWGERMRERAG